MWRLLGLFTEKLAFNKSQLDELEKLTRGQAISRQWRLQRIGCFTGTRIRDVLTRVKSLGKRSKITKVTPLLSKLFKYRDIDALPAVKNGRDHEKEASFF